jgi:hypothetical protein
MRQLLQWASTQTMESDEAQRERRRSQSVIDGLQSTIKKLEANVASQQMLCESLAKSFADQISVVRRFGDVHTGSSSSTCGRPHLCILCFRTPVRSVTFPCGHSAICARCRTMHALDRCPQCVPPPQLQEAVKQMQAQGGAASWERIADEDVETGAGAADGNEHIPVVHPHILKLLPPSNVWLGQQPDGSVVVTGWQARDSKGAAAVHERPTSAVGAVFPDASALFSSTPPLMFSTTPTRMVRVLAGRTAAGKVRAAAPESGGVPTESPFKVTSMRRSQGLHSMIQNAITAASAPAALDIPSLRPHSAHGVAFKATPDTPSPAPANVVRIKRPSSAVPKSRS